MNSTLIIAEAGVNHNGSIKQAKILIDIALESGADMVKFQSFTAENLVTHKAKKAEYQKNINKKNETQYEMIKKLELDQNSIEELKKYSDRVGINFICSPFDLLSIDILNQINIPLYKIPSGEITNLPYLRHVGQIGKPIIISTGLATFEEIEKSLTILNNAGTPKSKITVLHCNTAYPTPMIDVNLNAMTSIRNKFGVKVGYSDHTLGIEIPIAAVAMGACVIEKHFTMDRTLPGPDHGASLEPSELKAMIKAIRNIEIAMGDGIKRSSSSEIKNIHVVRKSIVAARSIKKGEYFSEHNLTVKRPGSGISPMLWDDIIGKRCLKNYRKDELIRL
jgi:N,N'-diacetyllegionaminate synthase